MKLLILCFMLTSMLVLCANAQSECIAGFCLTCAEGSYSLCAKCKPGYYLKENKICGLCDDPCDICSSFQICDHCNKGYYLLPDKSCKPCSVFNCRDCGTDGICTRCKSGYYLADNSTCIGCGYNCDFCDADKCLSCQTGYYPSSEGSKDCVSCSAKIPNCSSCYSETECISCTKNLYYPSDGKCESCSKMVPNCNFCTPDGICMACSVGYFISGTTCEQCSSNCMVCTSASVCTKCYYGYTLNNDACEAATLECKIGESRPSDKTECEACDTTNCTYCLEHLCLECKPGYYNFGGCNKCSSDRYYLSDCSNCISKDYYDDVHKCGICGNGCMSCSDSHYCTRCYKGHYLDVASETTATCISCPVYCEKCKMENNKLICEKCANGNTPIDGVCKKPSTNNNDSAEFFFIGFALLFSLITLV